MKKVRRVIGRHAPWIASAGIAATGYAALEALKESGLYEVGASNVPLWAWVPLAITVIGMVLTIFFLSISKTVPARAVSLVFKGAVFLLMLKYTIGFTVFG